MEVKENKKMLFVYNPKAGKALIRTKLADILDIFTAAGYEITIAPTQARGDATRIVAEKEAMYDVVVCSGGDGTLDETVKGMMMNEARTPLGYIPAGSTNDFAATLAIPSDMLEAAKIIVNGKDFPCDVGKFNDNQFIYVAAFGLFSEISYSTDQQIKNMLGHTAYLLSGAKSLINSHDCKMRVTHDGESFVDDFIYGMISNSKQVGGFQGITGKDVELDDGELEVTLIKKPKNTLELNSIFVALLERNLVNDMMYSFHTSEVTLESDEPVNWSLDGENGGSHTLVHITALQKAIDIKVEKEKGEE